MIFLSLRLFFDSQKTIEKNLNVTMRKQRKFLCFTTIFIFFVSCIDAQVKISGKILSKEMKPLEFVEVVLLNKDSVGVKSEIANEDGSFKITATQDTYTIIVRQFSKLFFSKMIDCRSDIDLGEIIVDNASHELGTVSVEVKDKLIERKTDRVVFNVENSISVTGGDALEALKITPGVRVQNDVITMIGKSTLSVMIDDKLIQLSGDELANYLKSIPADMIKSIEVMTIPPAKYDAVGNSGFVNIKLKKGKRNAWNNSFGATLIKRTYFFENGYNNFNYNKNKLSISASAFVRNGSFYVLEDDLSYFPQGKWHTQSNIEYIIKGLNGNFKLDYQLSSNWTIGTQLMIFGGKNRLENSPFSDIYDNSTGEIKQYIRNVSPAKNEYDGRVLNLYNEFKLDTLGKKVIVNLDYFYFSNSDFKTYSGTSVTVDPFEQNFFLGENLNDQRIPNLSGKIDVEYPVKWMNLSFGGKVSTSVSKNDISAFNSGIVDHVQENYQLITSKFKYNENVEALYVSASKKINKHWDVQLGCRVEATQTETFSENQNQKVSRDYIKFFPTAYFNYLINDNSNLTLSYSRRINRPNFGNLNPNVYYLNPYQPIEGNPFLQPAFIDNAELVHAYKNLQSKVYFTYEDNNFAQAPLADPDNNTTRFKDLNYLNTQRYGFLESMMINKIKWWTSTCEIDVHYTTTVSTIPEVQGKSGFSSRVSSSNDITLNDKKTLLLNLSYYYNFREMDGVFIKQPMHALSMGFQYLMLDKNLKLSLRIYDPFKTEIERSSTTSNNVYQNGYYYHDSRAVFFSVSYKFGNTNIKIQQRETGNEEERNRTGG